MSTFPNHTDPEFEITGGFVDGMSGIMSAAFAPIVTSEAKEKWEEYSMVNQDWIETSLYLEKIHRVHRDALHNTIQDHEHDRRLLGIHVDQAPSNSISKHIYRLENGTRVPETNRPGKIFAPLWQVSPADYSSVNVNLLSDPLLIETYNVMLTANHAILSRTIEIDYLVRAHASIPHRNCLIRSDLSFDFLPG